MWRIVRFSTRFIRRLQITVLDTEARILESTTVFHNERKKTLRDKLLLHISERGNLSYWEEIVSSLTTNARVDAFLCDNM